ncbi:hypothetical protein DDJ66_32275, partial [Klebsiella oxytoca]
RLQQRDTGACIAALEVGGGQHGGASVLRTVWHQCVAFMHYAYERGEWSSTVIVSTPAQAQCRRLVVTPSTRHAEWSLAQTEQCQCLGQWPMSDESDMPFSDGRVAICASRA